MSTQINDKEAASKKLLLTHASIARRGLAFVIDLVLCAFLAVGLEVSIRSVEINIPPPSWVYSSIFLLYFVILISHRYNATLGMHISGLRIIHLDGTNLKVWQAVLHTIGKFATLYAVISIAPSTVKGDDQIIAVIGFILLLIPVFHPQKQALHNLLLSTQVLYGESQLASTHMNIMPQEQSYWNGLSFTKILGNIVLLLIFLGLLHIGVSVSHDRNLISRTIYAISKTNDLKNQIEAFYLHYDHFPKNNVEISEFSKIAFPDGGGARVGKAGRIHIWFDILPELKDGGIWLTPDKLNEDQTIRWTCNSNGIKKQWLPSRCR